jgi:magnesium-protoporphyrin O-methyltransferase
MLIDALLAAGVQGLTLLDIGGGIGAIQYELLKAGASQATSVEASQAYLGTARQEAARRGLTGRVKHIQGDFVDLAQDIPGADIVTLDRVLCCYDEMEALVELSSSRARRYYAVVYPRDTWLAKVFRAGFNFIQLMRRIPFRIYIHPSQAVEAIIRKNGLGLHFQRQTFFWQVKVFTR